MSSMKFQNFFLILSFNSCYKGEDTFEVESSAGKGMTDNILDILFVCDMVLISSMCDSSELDSVWCALILLTLLTIIPVSPFSGSMPSPIAALLWILKKAVNWVVWGLFDLCYYKTSLIILSFALGSYVLQETH